MFELVGLLSAKGTLLRANRSALQFIDTTEADVIGRPFRDTPWWSALPHSQARIREAVGAAASGQVQRFDSPIG